MCAFGLTPDFFLSSTVVRFLSNFLFYTLSNQWSIKVPPSSMMQFSVNTLMLVAILFLSCMCNCPAVMIGKLLMESQ